MRTPSETATILQVALELADDAPVLQAVVDVARQFVALHPNLGE